VIFHKNLPGGIEMAKKTLNVLAVCGSGVVSSSMIEQKIVDALESFANVKVVGLVSTSVKGYVDRGGYDFVVTTSPIPGEINIPVIKGVALLTGFGEDAVIEEIQRVAKEALANKN
jgi:galactitol PTS system EIIB component